MTDTVLYFRYERLRDALQARRMSPADLAKSTDVTTQTISSYLSGKTLPSEETLRQMGEALDVRPFFLTRMPWPEGSSPVFERSLSPGTKGKRLRVRQLMARLAEIAAEVMPAVPLPPSNVPVEEPERQAWQELTDQQIDERARELREAWGIQEGPVDNLVQTAETNGILVGFTDMDDPGLFAASRWDGHFLDRACVMVNDGHRDPCDQRYELATEIGHLALQRWATAGELADRSTFGLAGRQARRFASALLAPGPSFGPETSTTGLDRFRTLKDRWKMPIRTMIDWQHDLGRLTDKQARELHIAYHRHGWSKEEPPVLGMRPETASMLLTAIDTGLATGAFTLGELTERFPLLPPEVERLAGLPEGYLTAGL